MPYTPQSLATFTLASAPGSPINLGTDDCWIERRRDENVNVEYIDVHCRYVDDSGSPAALSGANRLAAQNYFRDLVDSLGGITRFNTRTVGGHSRVEIVPRYDRGSTATTYGKGTLTEPFTGSSLADCYLSQATHEDEGWRGYEFTLTFFREIEETGNPTQVTFNGLTLGSAPYYTPVIVFGDGYSLRYRVIEVLVYASRADLQNRVAAVINSFKPKELASASLPEGRVLTLPEGAVVSTLSQTGDVTFSVSDVTCTSVEVDDDGGGQATLTYVFAKSLYTEVTDPSSDGRVAKFKGTALGNRPSRINVNLNSPNFIRYNVTARYEAADYATYPETLADTLGWFPLNAVVYPRGALGNQGAIKSYRQTAGILAMASASVNESDMFIEGFDVNSVDGRQEVIINFTFIKVR